MRMILTVLTLAACPVVAASAADAKAGQAVYDKSCKSCHGADGAANPAVAKMMKVEMKDLKSPEVQAMSDDELRKIVTDGKGKMKPVKSVVGKDIDNVVAYVQAFHRAL